MIGSEAVVTPSPGASLARACECLGVELRVYLPPGGEAVRVCSEAPSPIEEGGDLPFVFREGKPIILPQL